MKIAIGIFAGFLFMVVACSCSAADQKTLRDAATKGEADLRAVCAALPPLPVDAGAPDAK